MSNERCFKEFFETHGYVALSFGHDCPHCSILMKYDEEQGEYACQKCGHVYEPADDEPFVSSAECQVCGDTMQGTRLVWRARKEDGSQENPDRVILCDSCTTYLDEDI